MRDRNKWTWTRGRKVTSKGYLASRFTLNNLPLGKCGTTRDCVRFAGREQNSSAGSMHDYTPRLIRITAAAQTQLPPGDMRAPGPLASLVLYTTLRSQLVASDT